MNIFFFTLSKCPFLDIWPNGIVNYDDNVISDFLTWLNAILDKIQEEIHNISQQFYQENLKSNAGKYWRAVKLKKHQLLSYY